MSHVVTYTRTGHQGQVTKVTGSTKLYWGHVPHVLWLILHFKFVGVVHSPIGIRLDKVRVKFRSRSGQTRSNFKINIFELKIPVSDAEFYKDFNSGHSVTLDVLDLPKK